MIAVLERKKHNFFKLSVVFCALVILGLLYNWGYYQENEAHMMDESMGSMMRSMHGEAVNLGELLRIGEAIEYGTGKDEHHDSDSFIAWSFNISTALMVVILPFIIAGSIFLAIVWFK